ncbi:MAG TPA: TIR domain-containing protein, partial [Kofleriaceae bacterium]|nr:TIR domain-containing protein [Kofleriaceae bacterium]
YGLKIRGLPKTEIRERVVRDGASVAVLARGRGRVVMAASRRDGYSYVLPGRRNGLFTELLLDGLRGQAPGIGGVIRVCDLYHYVQQQVVARHRAQRPVFRAELEENYPLALYRGGAAPALVLPPPPDALRYDAFISYCRSDAEDEAWVHDVLLPALESYGLRLCLEERDFRLGRNRIKELERAVTSSRYTLCVLTPSYLAGPFETLCSELAQFHGVESQTVRFLPLLRRPCQPPMAARMLQLLDVSEPGASEHGPGRPRSMTRSAPGSRVRAALARLAVALREPADER